MLKCVRENSHKTVGFVESCARGISVFQSSHRQTLCALRRGRAPIIFDPLPEIDVLWRESFNDGAAQIHQFHVIILVSSLYHGFYVQFIHNMSHCLTLRQVVICQHWAVYDIC